MPTAAHYPLINCQSERLSQSRKPDKLARVVAAIRSTLQLWRSRFTDRRAFPVLGERELRDLGLSRWDVERELGKPFWRG
jgi:uncharacterized protein YjiS (DUF1127 family)